MKNNIVLVFLGTTALGLMFGTEVHGGIVMINPTKDNTIYAENGGLSNGAGQGIYVGVTAGNNGTTIRRALVQFDVAGNVPAGSTINSVTLTLQKVIFGPSADADILELHPVSTAWGEGTSFGVGKGAAATANDATWQFRQFSTQSWTNPGGDFGATSGILALDAIGATYTVSSQSGMVTNVQNWLNTPASNFGWLLKYSDENATATARAFGSRESGSAAPVLTIDFSPVPEPGSCLLLSVAAIVMSTRRRFARNLDKNGAFVHFLGG